MLLIFKVLAVFTKFKKIVPRFTVAVLEAIMKFVAFGCFYDMCKEAEIVAKGKKGIFMYLLPAFRTQISEYPPVLTQ